MTRFRAGLRILGSRTMTVWMAGLFIIYYLTMAVWSREAFANFVGLLSQSVPVKVVYVLFLFNVLMRSGKKLRAAWPDRAVFFLRAPLYCGVFLLLLSFFLSLNVRQNTWIIVGEGDTLQIPWDPGSLLHVTAVSSAIEKRTVRTDSSLIFSSEPTVTLEDERGSVRTIGAFPPRRVGSNYMHILNYGIGPGVELREGDRQLINTYMALRLTPFGSVDTFELPPAPYKFYLSILPNRVIRKGRETANQYDLERPLYRVQIVKGDKTIVSAKSDDQVRFDTMTLKFHAPADWVVLDIAYDPFLALFIAALLLTASGLVVYPFSRLLSRRGRKSRPVPGPADI